jgi:Uma2 family endonuclease
MLKTTARKKKFLIGPEDDGRRMNLADFDHAIAQEGYLYELGKGIIEVSDIPGPTHLWQLQQLREQLIVYKLSAQSVIHAVAGGAEAKMLIGSSESERHPDLSVYLSPPPDSREVWSLWIPELVVEIVSKRSAKRDYEEKPAEYLEFGVKEYWVVDAGKQQMTAMIRYGGRWNAKVVKPTQKYTTRLLPGFSLDLKKVLNGGK